MEKETPLREETSTLGSESDEEERIVGSETLSTLSRELSDIRDSSVLHIQWSHQRQGTAEREHGSSETVTCHGRTRRKKDGKSE